jgi:hypothetical protein
MHSMMARCPWAMLSVRKQRAVRPRLAGSPAGESESSNQEVGHDGNECATLGQALPLRVKNRLDRSTHCDTQGGRRSVVVDASELRCSLRNATGAYSHILASAGSVQVSSALSGHVCLRKPAWTSCIEQICENVRESFACPPDGRVVHDLGEHCRLYCGSNCLGRFLKVH